MSVTTWRQMLQSPKSYADDDTVLDGETLIAVAPDETVLDIQFYSGYGTAKGPPFLAWTATRVFFPVVYDGAEWIESVPRNPVSEGKGHVGGQ